MRNRAKNGYDEYRKHSNYFSALAFNNQLIQSLFSLSDLADTNTKEAKMRSCDE